MNRNTLTVDRRRRKLITSLWALALGVIVIVLIYLERADVLYILCTLGVAALLMVVAFADLLHRDSGPEASPEPDAPGVANKVR
jgi:hypothetical protein